MNTLQEWAMLETRDNEEELLHRSPREEFSFYEAVSTGDVEVVRQNAEQQRFLDMRGVGRLSKDPITNLKYHLVVATAMITRLCMQEGMETEQAYRLSDFYIMKLDSVHTLSGIASLHYQMALDFEEKHKYFQANRRMHRLYLSPPDGAYHH